MDHALTRSIDGVSHARRLSGIIGRMPVVARRASVCRTDARKMTAIPGDRVLELLPDLQAGRLAGNWEPGTSLGE
jgi:hypothetical protein